MKEGQGVSGPSTAAGAAAWIVQEEDAWRALEAGEEVMQSGIVGYRKGKVPEKCICMNCVRKGIECEWDKGGLL